MAIDQGIPEIRPCTKAKSMRVLFLTIFLDLLGFGIVVPQLPYYARACGASAAVVGLVAASYSLFQFLMAPFWGRLSDRIGRRPVILTGLVGSAVSYTLFGASFEIATWLKISPIPVLLFSRSLAGFFNANIAAAQAYLADITPVGGRAAAMGMVGAAFGLGFILGPAFSAILWKLSSSAAVPFYAAGLSGFLTFLWAYRVLPESRLAPAQFSPIVNRPRVSLWSVPDGPLRRVLLVFFLSTTAMSGMENSLGYFVKDVRSLNYDEGQFAALVLFMGLISALTQGIAVRRLSGRLRETQLLTLGTAGMVVAFAVTPLCQTTGALVGAMGLLCLSYGLTSPSLVSLISRLSADDVQGELLGVGQSVSSMGRILGPLLGGRLYDAMGPGGPYWCGAVLGLVAAWLVVGLNSGEAARCEPMVGVVRPV